jgi:glycosyltransferase involved in cell wall biosynthesis
MHVLYLIDSLMPSGAERSLAALAPHLRARGLRLDVAYLHERGGLRAELAAAGVETFSLAGSGGRLGWLRRARQLLNARAPDLLHTTLFEADVVGRIAAFANRVPVVSSLVNVMYGPEQLHDPSLRPWKVRGAQALDAVTARRVARFHAITGYVADVMARRLRIARDLIDVIPRGRDPGELGLRSPERTARARLGLGIGADETLVLAAARHERQKGLDVLLEAFPLVLRKVPKAKLVIAGRGGNQTALLHAHVGHLHKDNAVHFIGPRDDLPELLCGADVFVLPSRWEGFGGVLLEAMALQAPIVASDLPAVREVVTDGVSARLVSPENHEELATGIAATIQDQDGAADRAGRAQSEFLERFAVSKVAEPMVEFYDRALAKVEAATASEKRNPRSVKESPDRDLVYIHRGSFSQSAEPLRRALASNTRIVDFDLLPLARNPLMGPARLKAHLEARRAGGVPWTKTAAWSLGTQRALRRAGLLDGRPILFLQTLPALVLEPDTRYGIYTDRVGREGAAVGGRYASRFSPGWVRREEAFLRGADNIFVQGQSTVAALQRDYGISPSKITVVGCGPNMLLGQPIDSRECKTLLFVGTQWKLKGGPELLEAFTAARSQFPQLELLLVGSRPRGALPSGVRALGRVDRGQMDRIYSSADALVIPTHMEAFGYSIVEALIKGLPCIGTTVGNQPWTIGEAGLVVKPGDVAAIADAIKRMVVDYPTFRGWATRRGRELRENSNWENVAAKILERLLPPIGLDR